jgi:DNA (cytosine-5)-methyltransferase 1
MSLTAVDMFAGAGGFTTGAEAAGARVLWAANHWPEAVETHAANHPGTTHACQDLHQADWSQVPRHDLLLASPACQGHSRARGKDRPHHDAARSTAWAVVSCLEFHRPAVGLVENVEGFRSWVLYPAWRMAVQALGYSVAEHVVDAADFGVPQHRVRLFLVLSRSLAPLRLRLPRVEHVPASSIIDLSVGRWSQVDRPGRSAKTLARIAAGRAAHGPRFVTAYYGSTKGGRSLDRPLGTLTTRDRYAVIDGDRMRMLTVDENRAGMGFPAGYRLPADHKLAVHLLGNAVCPPVAAGLVTAIREAA